MSAKPSKAPYTERSCNSCAHLRRFTRPFQHFGSWRIGACVEIERIVAADSGALCRHYAQENFDLEKALLDLESEHD